MVLMLRLLIIITLQTFCLSSFSQEKSDSIVKDTCKIIEKAHFGGSVVSPEDLFHCHPVVPNTVNTESWDEVNDSYAALICHAHEWDNKSKVTKGISNYNLVINRGQEAKYIEGGPNGWEGLSLGDLRVRDELGRFLHFRHIDVASADVNKYIQSDEFYFYPYHSEKCKPYYKNISCEHAPKVKYCMGFSVESSASPILKKPSGEKKSINKK